MNQRARVPSKCLKNRQIIIYADEKEVATTVDAQTVITTLSVVRNLAECSHISHKIYASKAPSTVEVANRSKKIGMRNHEICKQVIYCHRGTICFRDASWIS